MIGLCHAQGIVIQDIEPRHVFTRSDGTFCLIDFDHAMVRTSDNAHKWEEARAFEEKVVNSQILKRK